MLVCDLHVRVINAATGELLRELTIDPARNYQPTGRPPGPKRGHRDLMRVHGVLDVLRHHRVELRGELRIRTPDLLHAMQYDSV
jgi:hypothetical protein